MSLTKSIVQLYAYNNDVLNYNKKNSKKNPVYKVRKVFGEISIAKYFKEEEITVKTKEPTVIVRTDNQIPQLKMSAKQCCGGKS